MIFWLDILTDQILYVISAHPLAIRLDYRLVTAFFLNLSQFILHTLSYLKIVLYYLLVYYQYKPLSASVCKEAPEVNQIS